MIETFTAELVVTQPSHDYEPELARLASAWFKCEVSCIALDVSLSAETGRFIAKGTFVPQPLPSGSRVEKAAWWLSLVGVPGPSPHHYLGARRESEPRRRSALDRKASLLVVMVIIGFLLIPVGIGMRMESRGVRAAEVISLAVIALGAVGAIVGSLLLRRLSPNYRRHTD